MGPGFVSPKAKSFLGWLSQRRKILFWLLLLVALALRLYKLNAYSIWLDEAWQYGSSDHPWDRIRNGAAPVDQMFLSLLVTHLHILTHFDADAWQLRMSPVIFGVASVGATFLFVREIFEERAAWIAASLAAFWPRLIQYSQEMRAYSLFVLLATIAAFALHRALRTNSFKYWGLFSLAVVLELYNHFIAATNALAWAIFAAIWILCSVTGSYLLKTGPGSRRSSLVRLGLAAGSAGVISLALLPVLPFYLRFQRFVNAQSFLGRSKLVLNGETLRRMFGYTIGLGDNATVYVIGGLALLGFGYACFRFARGAALCLLWIALPISLAMLRSSGEGLLFSTRYLQFVTPAYLALVAAGIVAMAAGVQTVIGEKRSRVPGGIPAFIIRFGLTVALITLTAAPLRALYSQDPKEVAVDLRSAYGYVLSRATSNDIVVGFGDIRFWNNGWFRVTDPYYLRKSDVVKEVITMGTMSYAAIPFRPADRAIGKLFAIVPTMPDLQTKIRQTAPDQFDTTCWNHICVLESRGQRPVSEVFDDFCERFEFIDPLELANVRPNVKIERGNSALPEELIPAQLNLELINQWVVRSPDIAVETHVADGLTISGWAIWEKTLPAGGVQIKIDDQIFKATYGSSRPDVAFYFDNPAVKPSGFLLRLPANLLPAGKHILRVQVLNPERTAFRSSQVYSVIILP